MLVTRSLLIAAVSAVSVMEARASCQYSQDDLGGLEGIVDRGVHIGIARASAPEGNVAHIHAVINASGDAISVDWRPVDSDDSILLRFGRDAIRDGGIACNEYRVPDGLLQATAPSRIKINAEALVRREVRRWVSSEMAAGLQPGESAGVWHWAYDLGDRVHEIEVARSFMPQEMDAQLLRAHGISVAASETSGFATLTMEGRGDASAIGLAVEGYSALFDRIGELSEAGAEMTLVRVGPESAEPNFVFAGFDEPRDYLLVDLPSGPISIESLSISQSDDPYLFFAGDNLVGSAPSLLDDLIEWLQ